MNDGTQSRRNFLKSSLFAISTAVLPGDTPESLAERVKAEERRFYPAVLADLLTGRIKTR